MNEFIMSAWHDVRQKKNLELYFILLATAAVLIADLVGIEATSAILEITLAVLALLAYGMIEDRRATERLEAKLHAIGQQSSSNEFFSEWDTVAFATAVADADEVWNMAAANYEFIHYHSESLKNMLQRGGKLRVILVDPNSYSALLAVKNASGTRDVEQLQLRIRLSMQELRSLIVKAQPTSDIEAKIVDHPPASVITVLNPSSSNAQMFVTINGFGVAGKLRPSFHLTKSDGKWFDFFLKTFENLWESADSTLLDIAKVEQIALGKQRTETSESRRKELTADVERG